MEIATFVPYNVSGNYNQIHFQEGTNSYIIYISKTHEFSVFENRKRLEPELEDLILTELTQVPKNIVPQNFDLIDRIKRIRNNISEPVTQKLSLTETAPGSYMRLRHYTTPTRAENIQKVGYFGGPTCPVAKLDAGRVFVELATDKVLTKEEFAKKYGISNFNTGNAYIEFLALADDLETKENNRTHKEEYVLVPQWDKINNQCIYYIESEVEVFDNE